MSINFKRTVKALIAERIKGTTYFANPRRQTKFHNRVVKGRKGMLTRGA